MIFIGRALTQSEDCLLSSHNVAMACMVVLMLGNVCSTVSSLDFPFSVGGGSCREVGQLGIQPPKSYCIEEVMDKTLQGFFNLMSPNSLVWCSSDMRY